MVSVAEECNGLSETRDISSQLMFQHSDKPCTEPDVGKEGNPLLQIWYVTGWILDADRKSNVVPLSEG